MVFIDFDSFAITIMLTPPLPSPPPPPQGTSHFSFSAKGDIDRHTEADNRGKPGEAENCKYESRRSYEASHSQPKVEASSLFDWCTRKIINKIS